MKEIRIGFVSILCIALLLPLINFNLEENYASPIDNRMLTEWNLSGGDITDMVESYINDRIGFRTEAIDAYTELNDKVFGMMVHPTYTYGKDGYVFFQMSYENPDPVFVELFCAYLRRVQDYCEERGVPFIYCLNPSKITIYQQYLPAGYIYQDKLNQMMYKKLKEYEVNYITNEYVLKEKSETEQVFNVKYDAGHWNDLGAFYGTNNILEKVSQYFPNVSPRDISEFEIGEVHEDSLLVSHFAIDEDVPAFWDKNQENIEDITESYSSMKMDQNYNERFCLINHKEGAEELPKVLVFQGSYYNERLQYFQSAFREYDVVHNYENLLDFDYYFNIFQPDCVILETAEYATNGTYFSYEGLAGKELNPVLDIEQYEDQFIDFSKVDHNVTMEGNLVTVSLEMPQEAQRAYLLMGGYQFDFSLDQENQIAESTIDIRYFQEDSAQVFFQ